MADKPPGTERGEVLRMAVDIVSAYVSNNRLPGKQIPDVIQTVFECLTELGQQTNGDRDDLKPAVSIRRSVMPDYIVCLEDGKKMKMLKRHIRTVYKMSPEEYRAKWKLPADYPMVAPNYAKRRSDFAKEIGLGRK